MTLETAGGKHWRSN